MIFFLNEEICKKCNGKCCKWVPGAAFPKDFGKPLYEKLKEAFATGKWAIDWWEGDPRKTKDEIGKGFFIRPRMKGIESIYHGAWGGEGECVFFIDGKGCKLKPSKRPLGCKLLEPKEDFHCIEHGGDKRKSAVAWMPYHEMLRKIVKEVAGEIF